MQLEMLKAKEYRGEPIKAMQVKYDGHRVMIERDRHGFFTSLTRAGCDIIPKLVAINHIAEQLEKLPSATTIDCELHCPGVHATSVKTMINDADPNLRLSPFAMPFCSGKDFRNEDLEYVMRHLQDYGFDTPDTWKFDAPVRISDQTLEEYKKEAKALRIEGFVLKQAHYAGWFKVKPLQTLEAYVVGYQLSDSNTYGGGLKSFDVALVKDDGTETVIATVGSGYDADFRMTCKPAEFLGKVAEIEYDSLASLGRLKFPRFKCWRPDKQPHDCFWDQIAEDACAR